VKIYTIGSTKKSASTFFGLLKKSGAERLVDVRLNNVSQLAGFAKRDDLKYFLAELCGMEYVHELQLAPNQAMLDGYKKHGAVGASTSAGSSTSLSSAGSRLLYHAS